MIDITTTWIPQIIGYADVVSDTEGLRRCWLLGECQNSVTSYDELIEQIFDDLDANSVSPERLDQAGVPLEIKSALLNFIESLRSVEAHKLDGRTRTGMISLVASSAWKGVEESAYALIGVANDYGLSRA